MISRTMRPSNRAAYDAYVAPSRSAGDTLPDDRSVTIALVFRSCSSGDRFETRASVRGVPPEHALRGVDREVRVPGRDLGARRDVRRRRRRRVARRSVVRRRVGPFVIRVGGRHEAHVQARVRVHPRVEGDVEPEVVPVRGPIQRDDHRRLRLRVVGRRHRARARVAVSRRRRRVRGERCYLYAAVVATEKSDGSRSSSGTK